MTLLTKLTRYCGKEFSKVDTEKLRVLFGPYNLARQELNSFHRSLRGKGLFCGYLGNIYCQVLAFHFVILFLGSSAWPFGMLQIVIHFFFFREVEVVSFP